MCDSENKPRQTNNIQVNIEQLQIILPKGDGETSLQINDKGQLSFSYTGPVLRISTFAAT